MLQSGALPHCTFAPFTPSYGACRGGCDLCSAAATATAAGGATCRDLAAEARLLLATVQRLREMGLGTAVSILRGSRWVLPPHCSLPSAAVEAGGNPLQHASANFPQLCAATALRPPLPPLPLCHCPHPAKSISVRLAAAGPRS